MKQTIIKINIKITKPNNTCLQNRCVTLYNPETRWPDYVWVMTGQSCWSNNIIFSVGQYHHNLYVWVLPDCMGVTCMYGCYLQKGSTCFWIKKQIELFHIHSSPYTCITMIKKTSSWEDIYIKTIVVYYNGAVMFILTSKTTLLSVRCYYLFL